MLAKFYEDASGIQHLIGADTPVGDHIRSKESYPRNKPWRPVGIVRC
jgi:hypothetical protein